jgi:hypothetical protein
MFLKRKNNPMNSTISPNTASGFLRAAKKDWWAGWLLLLVTASFCQADESTTAITTKKIIEGYTSAGQESVKFTTDSNQPEPTYQGVLISQWLQTNTAVNPRHLSLSALTTLKQVSPPDRMGIAKFEVPIKFDVLKTDVPNEARVEIGDFIKTGEFIEGRFPEYKRGTNGNCQIWLNINYEPPCKQDFRARLTYGIGADRIFVIGPPLVFDSPNACQFVEGLNLFDTNDVTPRAWLREDNAKFRVELTTTKGKHMKTFTGSTTNGLIDLRWDLRNKRGRQFKGDSFEGAFYIIYPADTHTNAPVRDTFYRVHAATN